MILQPVTRPGGGVSSTRSRFTVELTGTYDGSNRVFEFPEPVIHSPPSQAVRLYHGGRRMKSREFEIFEDVGGSGDFDRARITEFAPQSTGVLFADYVAA